MKDRIHIVSLDAPLSQRKTIVWKKVTRFVKTMAVAVLCALCAVRRQAGDRLAW
jgi:predicted nuclease with RNAse H fold